MSTFTLILVGIGLFFIGAFVIGLIQGGQSLKSSKSIESQIRAQSDFNPADVYVSPTSLTGIAIDRQRGEIILADRNQLKRFSIGSIVGCEVLQDDVQLASTNRGSQLVGAAIGGVLLGGVGAVVGGLSGSTRSVNNIQKIVLRILTDDFAKPNHDIILLDWSFRKKGLSRDNALIVNALETARLWHGRLTAMMKITQSQRTSS